MFFDLRPGDCAWVDDHIILVVLEIDGPRITFALEGVGRVLDAAEASASPPASVENERRPAPPLARR